MSVSSSDRVATQATMSSEVAAQPCTELKIEMVVNGRRLRCEVMFNPADPLPFVDVLEAVVRGAVRSVAGSVNCAKSEEKK